MKPIVVLPLAGVLVLGHVSAQMPAQIGTPPAGASEGRKPRVFVADSDSWQMQGSAGGNRAGWGAASSGGARPQTAEIIKTLGERCPQVTVNARPDVSDYVIKLDHEGGKGYLRKDNKVAVFVQSSGDSIFSESTRSLGGSVQGACTAMTTHWSAHAAEFEKNIQQPAPNTGVTQSAASISPNANTAAMAGLQIDSSVAGADIEIDGAFAGNTPSTLSVTSGQHTIAVKKKGYTDWSRTMNVSGSAVHLTANLDAQ